MMRGTILSFFNNGVFSLQKVFALRNKTELSAAFIVIAFIWGIGALLLTYEVDRRFSEAETRAQNGAHTAGLYFKSVVLRIEALLNEFADIWEKSGHNKKSLSTALSTHNLFYSDVALQVAVADRSGDIVFSSLDASPRGNIREREHFQFHQQSAANKLFIGTPVLGKVSNAWSVQFTYPLRLNGEFDGILVISVSPESLGSLFGSLSLGARDSATLVRSDGVALTRFPDWREFLGKTITGSPYLRNDSDKEGVFHRIAALDGIERIFGYVKIENYGLVATVGISTEGIYAEMARPIWYVVAVCLGLSLSVLVVTYLVIVQSNLKQSLQDKVVEENKLLSQGVEERKKELMLAHADLALAEGVFRNTAEGICVTDAASVILKTNRAFSDITGYSEGEALGRKMSFLHLEGVEGHDCGQTWRELTENGSWQGEFWCRRKDGEKYYKRLILNRLDSGAGAPVRYVGVFHDVTEAFNKEERIRYLAYYDNLTGLPNRTLFQDRLNQAIARSRREKEMLSIIFIDLDGFKAVNDSMGHDVGDSLLKEAAQRIRSVLRRDTDTVARLGGDEFVILMESLQDAERCASLAEEIIDELMRPFKIGGHTIYIGASLGLAFFPDDANSVVELMQCADTAMYAAKSGGKGTFRFFHGEMLEQLEHKLTLGSELRKAIIGNELVLFYQPKVKVADGSLIGVEALVRWQHPEKGLLSPAYFVDFAEQNGLIEDLGNWVIDEAAMQAAAWRDEGCPLTIAINISAKHLATKKVADKLAKALSVHGLSANAIEVEITETALMENHATACEELCRLRDMGATIAIDDFGTGYSSLSRIRDLPIDVIKIDRSFISGIEANENEAAIAVGLVASIIGIARTFKLDIVAEGVETASQADILKRHGEDITCQGYYYSKPVPSGMITGMAAISTSGR